MLVIIGHWFIE